MEKECNNANYPALLNSRYTDVYNRSLAVSTEGVASARRFPVLHSLVILARQFFGKQVGVLSLVNNVVIV